MKIKELIKINNCVEIFRTVWMNKLKKLKEKELQFDNIEESEITLEILENMMIISQITLTKLCKDYKVKVYKSQN